MPRTIWPTDPSWKGDPRWDNPSHHRGCAEEFHHEVIRRIFVLPPRLSVPKHRSPSSEKDKQRSRSLEFRGYNLNQARAPYLSHLKPDDAKIFCWKDCAVYSMKTVHLGADYLNFLEAGYKAWYPRRSADRDVSDGNFWGIHILFPLHEDMAKEDEGGCEETGKGEAKAGELLRMWKFHDVFCEHLERLVEGIEESEVGKWKVRESFAEVAMILEAGWREEGVRVVWKEDPVLNYVGFAVEELWTVVEKEQGEFWVLWCPLERAIRVIASRDPERRGGRREEWNELFEETLIDDDDAES